MPNPVAWFEIVGPDAPTLQSFYAQAFDWQIDANNEMNYGMVTSAEGGIAGGVGPSPDAAPHATFYVSLPDVQAARGKGGDLVGTTALPPMDLTNAPPLPPLATP